MALDLIIRNARLSGAGADDPTVDIGVRGGIIVAVGPNLAGEGPEHDARGKLVSPGLIESHLHLDKAMIVDRVPMQPDRTVRDHMKRTASIKHTFTAEDIYARAEATIEQCVLHGVTHMRTQVEVDPNVGLLGFEVIEQLRKDYAWAIDIQPCVFLQEGWTDVPGADENLVHCLDRDAPVVGGGIRYDKDGPGQIRRVFELAQHYDVDVDFHLDGGHDVKNPDYPQVCEITDRIRWQGRVAFGHGSRFSCMPVKEQAAVGKRLGESGVSLAVLPATDLFNSGRHMEHSVIRGVTDANTLIEHGANCTLSTNNVLNPFTPYGDCSLMAQAMAFQNATWLVETAKCGFEDGYRMFGHSLIVAPTGEIAAKSASEEDEVICFNADIDLAADLKRTMFNFAAHRRPEHYRLIVDRIGAEVTPANGP